MEIEYRVNEAITKYLLPAYNTAAIKRKFGDEVFGKISLSYRSFEN
jgi:hypothetical protein